MDGVVYPDDSSERTYLPPLCLIAQVGVKLRVLTKRGKARRDRVETITKEKKSLEAQHQSSKVTTRRKIPVSHRGSTDHSQSKTQLTGFQIFCVLLGGRALRSFLVNLR